MAGGRYAFVLPHALSCLSQGRNARGEEGLFPATYIQEHASNVAEAPPQDTVPQTSVPAAVVSSVPQTSPEQTVSAPTAPAPLPAGPNGYHVDSESIDEPESQSVIPPVQPAALAKDIPDSSTQVPHASTTPIDSTLGDIQDAIESINKPQIDNESELGIGQDTRARLAAQAKLANEQRDRNSSGGVAGLVYSDESEDEDEDYRHSFDRGSLSSRTNGKVSRNSAPVASSGQRVVSGASLPTSARAPPADSMYTPIEAETGTLKPALPLPATPPTTRTGGSPSQDQVQAWTVDQVVAWAVSKGFDDMICEKFRGA